MSRRTALKDETGDRGDAPALAHSGEATGGGDSPSAADGKLDPPSHPREVARLSESAGSYAAHRRWMAVAAACAVAAAVLLFTAGVNAAFVVAVLGALAWFWDQRNRIRAGLIEDEHSEEGRDELEEFEDEGGYDGGKQRSHED